jgi:hypothetical protein
MLELYASLRGVSKHNIDNEVKKWISLMGEWWNVTQATKKITYNNSACFLIHLTLLHQLHNPYSIK